MTVIVSVPVFSPVAAAVMVTVASGSAVELSTAAMATEEDCEPAGMVTVAGTVARLVLDDVSVTVSAVAVEPEREIDADAAVAPASSLTVAGDMSTVRTGVS